MKKILLLILLLGVIAGGVGYYMYQKPVGSVSGEKPDFTMTAGELVTAFQTDESGSNAKYLGKVIAVSGVIREIIPGEDLYMQVVLEGAGASANVSCVLEEPHSQFLKRNLKKGDEVRIKGKCSGADDLIGMQVILEPAVIID